MSDYKKQLWIYSILVIIACVASGITGLDWGLEINSTVQWAISAAGLVLFLFTTVKFALFLQLKPRQWVVAILLMVFFYVGSILYMTTRTPPGAVPYA
jgi:hypothetical protein